MKFVTKDFGRVHHLIRIDSVVTAGYTAVHCSSNPPYGPHIKKHDAEVWGSHSGVLKNVRVMSLEVEAEYDRLTEEYQRIREETLKLLDDNFLTFRLAQISDFPPDIVRQGKTAQEAKVELPKGYEGRKCKERGKQLAGLTRDLNKIL